MVLKKENEKYLKEQIITYLGNKRALLPHIQEAVVEIQDELGETKTVNLDMFSGSGIVARMLKKHSSLIIANDLENYSRVINECYLTNRDDIEIEDLKKYREKINNKLENELFENGVIYNNYAPKNINDIRAGDRVFYTPNNAKIIDTIRNEIENIPESLRVYFLAPLLYEASVKTNTSGVFKGFYKDSSTGVGKFGGNGEFALNRILGDIELKEPVFSSFNSKHKVYQMDANKLANKLKNIDITYIDPPYNQHPYGSNYFMLNLILENAMPTKVSEVSGIPVNWNRSNYNKKKLAHDSFKELVESLDSKYIIISYNSEGFITYDEMIKILTPLGAVKVKKIKYNTFRGSRNLVNRDLYVKEYIFTLRKDRVENDTI